MDKRADLAQEFQHTEAEFANPIAYISKMEKEVSAFGTCAKATWEESIKGSGGTAEDESKVGQKESSSWHFFFFNFSLFLFLFLR